MPHPSAPPTTAAPIRAGFAYWAVVFALGFVLGTIRALWGAQALGVGTFILIEVPIILMASWLAARWLVRRYAVVSVGAALVMGSLAFVLLILAELALSAVLASDGAAWDAMRQWAGSLLYPPALYGFLGQVAFALMPVLVVGITRKR